MNQVVLLRAIPSTYVYKTFYSSNILGLAITFVSQMEEPNVDKPTDESIENRFEATPRVGQKRRLSPETPEFVGKMSRGGDQTSLAITVEKQANAPATNNDEPASKRQKLLSNYSEKNPVMLLNELKPGKL